MSVGTTVTLPSDPRAAEMLMTQVADSVRAGGLAVVPTDTGYAVIADAFNAPAVESLRQARGHDADTPLTIGVGSLDTAHGVAVIEGLALDLAGQLWPGPLTILTRPQPSLSWKLQPSDAALAVRVPGHKAALGIIGRVGPVVMTGAHLAGEAPATTAAAAREALGDAVAFYVDSGEAPGGQSSVVDATGGNLRLLREGTLSLAQLRDVVPMLVRATS